MPDWTFLEDFGSRHPALAGSNLALLAFSDHTLIGSHFQGTLDVRASGVGLGALGALAEVTAIPVAGPVVEHEGTLAVSLTSSDDALRAGLARNLPLIGPLVSGASLGIAMTVTAAPDADADEELDLSVTLALASGAAATLQGPVPMGGGTFAVSGTFEDVALELSDLDPLLGGSATAAFPTHELSPYVAGTPPLQLLGIGLDLAMVPVPLAVAVSSASVSIGIAGIAVYEQALYLDPLAVSAHISPPFTAPTASWWLEGCLALCNHATPGQYRTPDAVLDLEMGLSDFSFTARLDDVAGVSLATLVQDLAGADADTGLPPSLEVAAVEISGQADRVTGKVTSFSAAIAMTGDVPMFGVELTGASLRVAYSG